MYVCMYVCMYVRMSCMYVRMYVCMYVCEMTAMQHALCRVFELSARGSSTAITASENTVVRLGWRCLGCLAQSPPQKGFFPRPCKGKS